MNTQDPKYQQKSIPICSPEQNYLSLFAMRYPVLYTKHTFIIAFDFGYFNMDFCIFYLNSGYIRSQNFDDIFCFLKIHSYIKINVKKEIKQKIQIQSHFQFPFNHNFKISDTILTGVQLQTPPRTPVCKYYLDSLYTPYTLI